MGLDLKTVKLTRLEEAEIGAGLRSWAAAHIFIMEIEDADLALKTLKYAVENKRPRDMVQRILHRFSSLHRREMAVQVSRLTKLEIT